MAEVQPATTQSAEEPAKSLLKDLVNRDRLMVFGVTLAIELIIFFGAMIYPINPSQQQELVKQANSILGSTGNQTSVSIFSAIFSNNARVALVEMVPAAGAALFAASIFTTGQVIQALALNSNLPGPLFGLLIFFFPFAIVELSAYAIAVASGSMLILSWRRKRLRREVKVFSLEVGLVVFCVLLAAAMETVGIVNPVVGFALWLPTAVGIFALVMAARGSWR
jgi:hypothetical protein